MQKSAILFLVALLPLSAQRLDPPLAADTQALARDLAILKQNGIALDPVLFEAVSDKYEAWIDSRVRAKRSTNEIEQELRNAKLLFEGTSDTLFGLLLVAERSGEPSLRFLQLGVGTECGFSPRLAVYDAPTGRKLGAVRPFDPSNAYSTPLQFDSVVVGAKDAEGERILAIAGSSTWCTSRFGYGWVGIARIGPTSLTMLLAKSVGINRGESPWTRARLEAGSVIFEYDIPVFDEALSIMEAVEIYKVVPTGVVRAAPPAKSIYGFLEQWLAMSDEEIKPWSTPQAAASHKQALDHDETSYYSVDESRVCSATTTHTWHVVLTLESVRRHFVIEENGADALRMIQFDSEPPPSGCAEATLAELLKELPR